MVLSLIAEYVRELLAISKDGCIGRSGFQVLFVCSVLAIAGCGDSDKMPNRAGTFCETDVLYYQAATGTWPLGCCRRNKHLALVESPDDHDATIVAAKAEAARGSLVAVGYFVRSIWVLVRKRSCHIAH